MLRWGRMSLSLIIFQMIRVISSPSISTMGVFRVIGTGVPPAVGVTLLCDCCGWDCNARVGNCQQTNPGTSVARRQEDGLPQAEGDRGAAVAVTPAVDCPCIGSGCPAPAYRARLLSRRRRAMSEKYYHGNRHDRGAWRDNFYRRDSSLHIHRKATE